MWTDEEIDQHAHDMDTRRPDLQTLMEEQTEWAMTLSEDPFFYEQLTQEK